MRPKKTVRAAIVAAVFAAVFFVFIAVLPAHALETGLQFAQATGLPGTDIRIVIARIIRALFGFVGVAFVLLVLYGGWLYMTAAGQAEKITKAKAVIRNAAIGVAIMLSAYSIASLIIRSLISATTGGFIPGPGAGYGAGGGALGGGIIESHYPGRNATGIPRNTSIVATFKEPMLLSSLIDDTNGSGVFGDCVDANANGSTDFTDANTNGLFDAGDASECDLVKAVDPSATFVRIRKSADQTGPYLAFVKASATSDAKTIVYRPVQLLGSANTNTLYTVELTTNIKKENGDGAFGNLGSYAWSFEVSTVVDLTPPLITSVIPMPSNNPAERNPRNSVVQINFNEAINPITIRGVAQIVNDATVGALAPNTFDLITAQVRNGQFVGGEFFYSNQYTTVEFITNDPCGINSCGEQVFCLPGNETLTVKAKAATLETAGAPTAVFPYTGIVDMADNSLDGNGDAAAQGPQSQSAQPAYNRNDPRPESQGDDYQWSFNTNDTIDLVPPEIASFYPAAGAFDANPAQPFEVRFSKLMMTSSLKPDGGYGDGKEHITLVMPDAATLAARQYPPDGWAYWIVSNNNYERSQTTAVIQHEQLGSKLPFGGRVGSAVKDLYQNCYQPCAGPGCQRLTTPTPGQYVVKPGSWLPSDTAYPTCDLSQSGATPAGAFTVTFRASDGTQQTRPIAAFGMDQSAASFYGYASAAACRISQWGVPFSSMQAPNRAVSFLYKDTLQNKYYFTAISGIDGPGGVAGQVTYTLTGAGALDTSGSPDQVFAVKDDPADTYSNDGTTVRAQFAYGQEADGTMVSLGTGAVNYTFTAGIAAGPSITEWVIFYPGGSIALPTDQSITIGFTAD